MNIIRAYNSMLGLRHDANAPSALFVMQKCAAGIINNVSSLSVLFSVSAEVLLQCKFVGPMVLSYQRRYVGATCAVHM